MCARPAEMFKSSINKKFHQTAIDQSLEPISVNIEAVGVATTVASTAKGNVKHTDSVNCVRSMNEFATQWRLTI
jgi:hypothetical protein